MGARMDIVRSVYALRWVAPVVFVGGMVVLVLGCVVQGKGGADLGRLGTTMTVVAALRIGYLARTDNARLTFRYLRCAKRTEPVAAAIRRDGAQ